MKNTEAIQKAIDGVGGLASLARAIGRPASEVWQWKTGRRPVPVGRCLSIESATSGAVTRQDLRPDDYWLIWPDLEAPGDACGQACGAEPLPEVRQEGA